MNWKSSLHEIFMLTFGQALTMDEVYRCLLEQREDRMFSIASAMAESKRAQAKVIGAKATLDPNNTTAPKSIRRRSEAFLIETNARFMIAQPCLDMARVELNFIQRLIEYIDSNNLRIHSNVFEGSQLVQPMESAYELAWAVVLEPTGNVMRNYLSHPHALDIQTAVSQVNKGNLINAREILTQSFAQSFGLQQKNLAISVNDVSSHIEAELKASLPTYAASFATGFEKLKAITHDQDYGLEGALGSHS